MPNSKLSLSALFVYCLSSVVVKTLVTKNQKGIRSLFIPFLRLRSFTISTGDVCIYFVFLEEDPGSNYHQDDNTDSKDDDVGGDAFLGTAESLDTFDFSESFPRRDRASGCSHTGSPAPSIKATVDAE